MQTHNCKDIYLPLLATDTIVTCYAQQRPKRNGGYLLRRDKIADKIVIHNYGHGGAGVSLAPGCAAEAVCLAQNDLKNISSVAVIGSGVIGLFTCLELTRRYPAIKIKVYASRIPTFGQKDNNRLITSQVAPGFWFPFHYGRENDAANQRIASHSFKTYHQMTKTQQYSHIVKEVDTFDLTDNKQMQEEYSKNLFAEIEGSYRQITLRINDKTIVSCWTFKTIKIDMQPFLEMLMNDLKSKGVTFTLATINEKDLSSLPHAVIFNCTGLGSRTLFKDTQMKGVKGHLVEYRNPDPQRYNCIITANFGKQIVDYYMHDSRILLGFTEEDTDNCIVEQKQVQMLQNTHRAILQKFGIVPQQAKL